MPHRRDFVNAAVGASGIVAAGCSLLDAAQPGAGRRRKVTLGGRRVKTVDVHAHCAVPEALALMRLPAGSSARWDNPQLMIATSGGPDRLRVMDLTAITLCMERSIPLVVFNLKTEGNISRVVRGENVGTKITPR